jgi:hypothetical protein
VTFDQEALIRSVVVATKQKYMLLLGAGVSELGRPDNIAMHLGVEARDLLVWQPICHHALSQHPIKRRRAEPRKRFTSVSPGQSGHYLPSLRAPMLGGPPLTDMVSSKQARTRELWIGRLPRGSD